jgi:hypothetical protein
MECKNCSSNLKDEDGFCSYCGSRVIKERISIKFLFQEFLDKVLSVDNKLLKTFWHLFTKPHKVIEAYINGVRKRYFNPMSYLLISITLAGIYFFFLKDFALESIEAIPDVASENPFTNKEFAKSYLDFFTDYQAFFSALIIPLYGLISWIVFLNRKKYNFYEHLVIYLYGASQLSILSFLLITPVLLIDKELGGQLVLISSLFMLIYFPYVLIRLFKLTFWQFVVKTLYFLVVTFVLYIILSIIAVIGFLVIVGPEYFQQFAPKKQNDSIQKVQPIDSLKNIQKKDSIKKDKKTISYHEASSKLNCLS